MKAITSRLVFLFPGQGSYNPALLQEMHDQFPGTRAAFAEADRVCQRFLGYKVTPVFTASKEEHDRLANECPDVDQVGIFLTSYLVAQAVRDLGIQPDLMLGHSFGEIAALASAGVFPLSVGLKIVCQRILSLQGFALDGRMMAVSCEANRVSETIHKLHRSGPSIAVINHPRQTVVSGTAEDLEPLSLEMNRAGVSTTILKARYPFHSPLLTACVQPFRLSLEAHEYTASKIPVYLGVEQKMLAPSCDLPALLSKQFVQPLNFLAVINEIYGFGYEHFIECGGGNIVTKIVQSIVGDKPGLVALPAVSKVGLKLGLSELIQSRGASEHLTHPRTAIAQLVRKAETAAQEMRDMLAEVSRLAAVLASTEEPELSKEPAEPTTGIHIAEEQVTKTQIIQERIREECPCTPAAIVAMGCVLPGASNVDQYWTNIMQGVSGIVDMAKANPLMAADYLDREDGAEIKIKPDKTYTLLHGSVGEIRYDAALLLGKYRRDEFEALTRGERILALAFAQCLATVKSSLPKRIQCILGATADGSAEYDEARFIQSVGEIIQNLDEPIESRISFSKFAKQRWADANGRLSALAQHDSYQGVCRKIFGKDIDTYIIDTACSSSLYSINLGMRALENGDADLVIAGGVFAPGPANNALFAQFRGLTPSQSRPFDAGADGVVFGDGAAVVLLKRLSDAIDSGDSIAGVIRGIGLSSDGKSPATNVPQSKGQSLAIRRAYENSGIDPATIQYVEAHATSTPVGDAVEFNAIASTMPKRADGAPFELGSVKALIGHTGWAAGAASVIKLCKALVAQTVPAQYNYETPSPQINLQASPCKISTSNNAWPQNMNGLPRRASINGFGFGGTDAHLVLEAFDHAYHKNLCAGIRPRATARKEFAVVGFGALFPRNETLAGDEPSEKSRFLRDLLRLPERKRLLPDVVEHMDPSQFLALLAADKALSMLPANWRDLAGETAIVLGIESKTERGTGAGERIFKDRLRRLVSANGSADLSSTDISRLLNKVIETIDRRNRPSNAYTLPGLMPNVATGRIANVFDLNGPNVVVDKGRASLAQALLIGAEFLSHGDCKLALAGALHAAAGNGDTGEAAILLAMTTPELAEMHKLPILGMLDLASSAFIPESAGVPDLRAAEGAREIAAVLRGALQEKKPAKIAIPAPSPHNKPETTVAGSSESKAHPTRPASQVYQYVQGTPISLYRPELVATPAQQPPLSLQNQRILFITDQPGYWRELEESGILNPFRYSVICPLGARLRNAVELDLESDIAAKTALSALAGKIDVILAIKTFEGESSSSFLDGTAKGSFPFLDLLFSTCKSFYDQIRQKEVSVLSVCLDTFRGANLHPYSGLIAGLLKSVARECPESVVRILNVEQRSFLNCLADIELELGQKPAVEETCIRRQSRHTIQLAPLSTLTNDQQAYLNSDSVVIATGGGRGVTAVMVEELLSRFGCRVIAVGRTDPAAAPPNILAMSDAEFQAYESVYYAEQIKLSGPKKITELKQQYAVFGAVRELHQVRSICQSLPGSFEYVWLDITDKSSVESLIEEIARKYGRIDLILHGAGIQISQSTPKKSLQSFRKVVNTKLASLGLIYAACQRRQASNPPHVHILTSAFSYMGNDGQPDYGAANEALNRLAVNLCGSPGHGIWSSMAWLGWAGIGMTRGSEYAALAASRRLRGVTEEEGREIFAQAITGTPASPAIIQIAAGEVAHYGIVFAPPAEKISAHTNGFANHAGNGKGAPRTLHLDREISLQDLPYLSDHLVNGAPTLPGAFLIAEIGAFALKARPELKIAAFENAIFHRFVKVPEDRAKRLRLEGEMLEENDEHALLKVKVYSDFVHRSGAVLQKDVLQTEVSVRLVKKMMCATTNGYHADNDHVMSLDDPYVMEGSPVRLKGRFRTMSNIVSGSQRRRADYYLDPKSETVTESACVIPKIMMMDSLWRFGAILRDPDNSLPVYVPVQCDVMKVYFDFADLPSAAPIDKLTFSGANPMTGQETITIGPVAAVDTAGQVLLVVEGGVCRRYGTVNYARA